VIVLDSYRHTQNDKAAYTNIDSSTKQEPEVTHVDLQGLQKLHNKILRAEHAVNASSQILSTFCARCTENADKKDPKLACGECSEVLRSETFDLMYHFTCLVQMGDRLQSVSRLVCLAILECNLMQVLTLTVVERPRTA
jgi:hypothetical protein